MQVGGDSFHNSDVHQAIDGVRVAACFGTADGASHGDDAGLHHQVQDHGWVLRRRTPVSATMCCRKHRLTQATSPLTPLSLFIYDLKLPWLLRIIWTGTNCDALDDWSKTLSRDFSGSLEAGGSL